jgi:hypothetical protein
VWIDRYLFTGVAALTFVSALAGSATASCAAPAPLREAIKDAPAVFVGTVIETANRSRWATVHVEEVWKGTGLPDEVEVRAGPEDPPGPGGTATSVDRTYTSGTRYLFVPYDRSSQAIFQDNACTRTSQFRSPLERFRPARGEDPDPSTIRPAPRRINQTTRGYPSPWLLSSAS